MVATLMELMEKSDREFTDDVDDHVHAMVYIWLKYFFSSLNFTEFGFCPKTLKKKKLLPKIFPQNQYYEYQNRAQFLPEFAALLLGHSLFSFAARFSYQTANK